MKSFFIPTFKKILLTIGFFILLNLFFFICSPLEFETLGPGVATGRHISYKCGFISNIIFNIRGSAWTRDSSFDWIIYLLSSYFLSSTIFLINYYLSRKREIES